MAFETLLFWLILAGLAVGALGLWAVLRHTPRSGAMDPLGRGDFAAALAAARTGPGATRSDLWAAAVAAKHLLELDRAAALLDRLLRAEPDDGEAWLERGLVAAYAGEPEQARAAFARAEALRSDLAESLTLHRAWATLRAGDARTARRLFEEVEAPLETKLRMDLGGDPLFAEWFLQAAALWRAAGDAERADWAEAAGRAAAPASRLPERL